MDLTPENCKKFPPEHPRCGTSFIFIVLIVSIIVFSLVWHESFLIKFLQRVILIPVIASLSYEILKLTVRKQDFKIMKLLSLPGIWIQKITTKQPDNMQLEVAIEAIKRVI